jgi:hypothetical protein
MTVWDRRLGQNFLVYSGADESVFPLSNADRRRPRTANLVAANGSVIKTYGRRNVPLLLANNRSFIQEFWLAEVTQLILCADFFIANGLAIDLAGRRLLSLDHLAVIPARAVCSASIGGLHQVRAGYESILDEFPELLVPRFRPDDEVKHSSKHHITTSGPPLHARARRLHGEKLAIAKAEFTEMERLGIIRRSDSPWASPLHIAPKPGGGWRPCATSSASTMSP